MPTVFERLSDGFYTAFFESDPEKRRASIEAWIKDATPVVQSAVENELRSYLEYVLEQTWTAEGWQSRARKFSGTTQGPRTRKSQIIPFIDGYRLRLQLDVSPPWNSRMGEKIQVVDPVSPETHTETLRLAHETLSQIDVAEATRLAKLTEGAKAMARSSNGNTDDDDGANTHGHSPNDDRSDSMNPNNDAYQTSMDNRSDQMNPNNDAYWSSRGR